MQLTIDDKLRLLIGKPIEVNNFGKIHPLTLSEIVDIGYINYLQFLKMFTFKKEHFMKNAPEELMVFDFLMMADDVTVQKMLIEALEVFLKEQVTIIKEHHIIAIGTSEENLKFINRNIFEDVSFIIQVQNYIHSIDDSDIVNSNDKAKEIQEKINRSREEVNRIKSRENEDETDFFDIVSAVSAKGNISKSEILNYTIFEIYDKYKRLIHIDQYDTGIMALSQGAKNVKLKHWSTKIKS